MIYCHTGRHKGGRIGATGKREMPEDRNYNRKERAPPKLTNRLDQGKQVTEQGRNKVEEREVRRVESKGP